MASYVTEYIDIGGGMIEERRKLVNSNVDVNGNFIFEDGNLISKSPDGTKWKIKADDNGILVTEVLV